MNQIVSIEKLSTPHFQTEASKLMRILKNKKASDLEKTMKLSKDLAKSVKSWHISWGETDVLYQAALVMKGEAFKALDFKTLSKTDKEYARPRLFILSGLYGALTTVDFIQPYRLEMAQKFSPFDGSKSLNAFWSERLPKFFNLKAEEIGSQFIANLASDEYNKVVLKPELNLQVINFSFKVETDKGLKNISVFAKQARGAMARYIIENQITTSKGLKGFDYLGFRYRTDLSSTLEFTYTRTR